MKAVVAAFNQEKALVGAFSVITNLRMDLFEALMDSPQELGPVARRRQARKNRLDMCKFIFIEYCYN